MWEFENKEIITATFPAAKDVYTTFENHVGCSTCAKRSYATRIRNIISREINNVPSVPKEIQQWYDDRQQSPATKAKTTQTKTQAVSPVVVKKKQTVNKRTSLKQPRAGCMFCVKKHLSQAGILLNEFENGYDGNDDPHFWLAIGHLAEAADEAMELDEKLADEIRQIRIALTGQENV